MIDRPYLLGALVVVQVVCAVVFMWDLLSSLLGLRTSPVSWQTRELIELGAALGLLLGLAMGGVVLLRAHQRSQRIESQLRAASGAFQEVLQERFKEWNLTAAEKDVAMFAIKGLSLQEIAAMRNTSDGTVKAQTNAIYRKAGVNGRTQLLSVFIDELMEDGIVEP